MAEVLDGAGGVVVIPSVGPPGVALRGPVGPIGAASTVPGPQGIQGLAGAGTVVTRVASAYIPPWAAVVSDGPNNARPADPSNPDHRGLVIGVTAAGAVQNGVVTIQAVGDLLGAIGGLFGTGGDLFVGAGGLLTAQTPASGWRQIVAKALSPAHIVVALGEAQVISTDDALLLPNGLATRATPADIAAGTSNTRYITPAGLTTAPPSAPQRTAFVSRAAPRIAGQGRIDPMGLYPESGQARGPLLIINNPALADLGPGVSSGLYVHVGNNPTATPGAGDAVACTLYVNNLNGRSSLFGLNAVAAQAPAIQGGTDGRVTSAEFEIANAFAATEYDPWGGGFRKNGVEITGMNGSVDRLTCGLEVWANDATGAKWWYHGIGLSRIVDYGIWFAANPGGSQDAIQAFSKAAIYDGSNSAHTLRVAGGGHQSIICLDNPGYDDFVRAPASAAAVLPIRNRAEFDLSVLIDSGLAAGGTSARAAWLKYGDRGNEKWWAGKDAGNGYQIYNAALGSTALRISPESNISFRRGDGAAYNLDVGGGIGFSPGNSQVPSRNGDVVFEFTNNTTLTIRAKGSDGIVRSGAVTLS